MLAIIKLQNDLEKMEFDIAGEAREYVGGRNGGIWSLVSSSYEQAKREEIALQIWELIMSASRH